MFGNNGSRIASWLISFLPTSRCFDLKRLILRKIGGIDIGDGTCVWSGAKFCGSAIKIGKNCHIGTGTFIMGVSQAPVVIGDEVSFGPNVFLTVGTHDVGDAHRRSGRGRLYPIEIGDGTAISVNSIIMPNVKIGKGCFIGPGVVVSRNVPDNVMLGNSSPRQIPLPEEGISWE